jgi:hypothetical protein
MPTIDEAIAFTLNYLRRRIADPRRDRPHGYDLYVQYVAETWAIHQGAEGNERDRIAHEVSAQFFDAAWELCRRGLLKPTVHNLAGQGVTGGRGYSLTPFAAEWLPNASEIHFISMQPGALAAAFQRFAARFGSGYHQRTQEAVRCRTAEAWLASCAMVGAAAESVLLAAAIAKVRDEDRVVRQYAAQNGRRTVLNILTGQATAHIARGINAIMPLLSYWRDTAAHGQIAEISAHEAEQAIRELLALSQFVSVHWDEIIAPVRQGGAGNAELEIAR